MVRRISGSLSRSDPLDCLQSLSLMRRLVASGQRAERARLGRGQKKTKEKGRLEDGFSGRGRKTT